MSSGRCSFVFGVAPLGHRPGALAIASALVLGVMTPAASPAQSRPPASASTKQLRAELEREVPVLMRAGDIPGLSIAVIRNGKLVWSGAFGVRSTETQAPVDRHTVFDAASLSKPVFAVAVLRMAERGEVDLDAPLAPLLPNPRMAHDGRYTRFTPRMLLSHSTGLPNWGGERLDLVFDPGTGFNYSGEGYVYLARALETRTGLPLEELVAREVFRPLGMTRSSFVSVDSLEANGTVHHDEWGKAMPPRRVTEANAAASLRTTAEDYAKFLIGLVGGRLLRRETLDAMLAPRVSAADWQPARERPAEVRDRIAWGLGVGLQRGTFGTTFWHWGDNGNAKAYIVMDPVKRTGVVFLANGQSGLSIASSIAALALPERQWAIDWLAYEQFDEPGRVARRAILRAFLEQGVSAGVQRYRQERERAPAVVTMRVVGTIAGTLIGQRRTAEAIVLLSEAAEDFPDSSAVYLSLGDAYVAAGDDVHALGAFQRAAALDTGRLVRDRIAWVQEALESAEHPVVLDEPRLRRFVGSYGARRVTLENGRLYYQRAGNARYPLTPLADATFALEGLPTFRVHFVADSSGAVTTLVGLYANGQRDESSRSLPGSR